MKPFTHVLIGTDFSEGSRAATAAGLDFARRVGAQVTLINVTEPYTGEEAWPSFLPVSWGELRQRIYEAHHEGIQEELSKVDTNGVEVDDRVVFGSTSLKLAQMAEELDTDVLWVSASGKSNFERALIGSTAESLIKQSNKPVWVYRGPWRLERIVVAVDDSEAAVSAARLAARIARATEASLDIVRSFADPGEGRWYAVADDEAQHNYREAVIREARRGFDKWLLEHRFEDLDDAGRLSSHLLGGKAWRTIVDHAEDRRADLVVVGSRGHGYLHRLFLGSTAAKIARHATSSVLIVPPESDTGDD